MGAKRTSFGTLTSGQPVPAVELWNGGGGFVRILALGAAIQSLRVPDRDGNSRDVVLGYATPADYLAHRQFFGATVGRYANRIAHGAFVLDGKPYVLDRNDGPHHLHGGVQGFDQVLWSISSVGETPSACAVLRHVSVDGHGGYPGTVEVIARYAWSDRNALSIEYRAVTDRPTIVNLTNHSYFNLGADAGAADAMGHLLTLFADAYTPVDSTLIPTGELRSVAGTPFDFRSPCAIGERIEAPGDEQLRHGGGYDHNFVLRGPSGELRPAARLEAQASGRVLEVLTTAPGMQLYSGNLLDARVRGKEGRSYRPRDAVCLEPQIFPDAPNQPAFPSARLAPGSEYRHRIELRFSVC